jgi:hypothetical protein
VRAFKFLRPGRVAPFAGVVWPEPGTWLESEAGVHAVEADALAAWIAEELWVVELDEARALGRGVLVAPRGRLAARVAAWDDETAREFARTAAEHAGVGAAGRAAEYAAQAAREAETVRADSSATTVGYIAARAAEAKSPGGFEAERRRQSVWLAERLALAPPG